MPIKPRPPWYRPGVACSCIAPRRVLDAECGVPVKPTLLHTKPKGK